MAASPRPAPRRPPGSAGIGSIFVLAFLVILVPAIVVYGLLTAVAGLAIGPAGLLGLLVAIICLGFYPKVLMKLGWVPARRR